VRFDIPTPDNETQPFWDAAKDGRLLIQKCLDCGDFFHYPRPFCPACWSENIEWVEASGRGTLYTWSLVAVNDLPPFNERVPYVAAIVQLEEGPRIMTNIVDCDPGTLRADQAVVVKFTELDENITIPVFTPAA
jgi:uncharacterized OB-fold protein